MEKQDIYLPGEEKGKYSFSSLLITKTKNLAKRKIYQTYQWELWEDTIMEEIQQQQELASKFPQHVLGIRDWFVIQHPTEVELFIVYDCDQDAKSLFDFIKNNTFTIHQQLRYKLFEQLLNLGIIVNQIEHRNIKTGNVIYYKGNLMLTDFGSPRTHNLNYQKEIPDQKKWQFDGLFYCCQDFVKIMKTDRDFRDQDWQELFHNEEAGRLYSRRNDFWGLMIYALRIFTNQFEIDYSYDLIWSVNMPKLLAQLQKLTNSKVIYDVLYDALVENPTKNYEKSPEQYLEKFKETLQQYNEENYEFEKPLVIQLDDQLIMSKTTKNRKYIYSRQELKKMKETIKFHQSQRQRTQDEYNMENKVQPILADSIYNQETNRDEVEFMKLGAFSPAKQVNQILQPQDLRKLNPQESEEYIKELKSQRSQTNSQPIIQKILVSLETAEELNRIKNSIDKFIDAPKLNQIIMPGDLQQMSISYREDLKQNLLRIQNQPQYQDVREIIGKQLEMIDELQPQQKLTRFIINPSRENLVNVQSLNEAEIEQKDQFKEQLPMLKTKFLQMDQVITNQINLVDETEEIQTQLQQLKSNPQSAQPLQINQLTKLSDDQLVEYKNLLKRIQTQPNRQNEDILQQLSRVDEIEHKRQQLKNIISNPRSGQVITTTELLKLGQDNLDQAIKQLQILTPEQRKLNNEIPQNLQAAQYAQMISEQFQRLKNQPKPENLLLNTYIKELPNDILEDYNKKISMMNPQKREEQDILLQQIKQIQDIQDNQKKVKEFLSNPEQINIIDKMDLKNLNNEDLLNMKQQLELLKQDPQIQQQILLKHLKNVEDQIKQNNQNQNKVVQSQQQILVNPINLLLSDDSELDKIQAQLNKSTQQDQNIINKLKQLIKLKQDKDPLDQILIKPVVKELIQILEKNPAQFQPVHPDNMRQQEYIQRQVQQQILIEEIEPQSLNPIQQKKPFGHVAIEINPQNNPIKVLPQFLSPGKLDRILLENPQLEKQYQQHLNLIIQQHPHLKEIAERQQKTINYIKNRQRKNIQFKKNNLELTEIFSKDPSLLNDQLLDAQIPRNNPRETRPITMTQPSEEPERQLLLPSNNRRLDPLQRTAQVQPLNDPIPNRIMRIDNIQQARGRQEITKANDIDIYNQLGEEFYTVDLDWEVLSNDPTILQFQYHLRLINYKLIIPKKYQIDRNDKGSLNENYEHQANGQPYWTKYGGQWANKAENNSPQNVPNGYGIMMRKKNGSIYQGIFQQGVFVYGFVIELSGKNIQFYVGQYHQAKQLKCDLDSQMVWIKFEKNQFYKLEEHQGPIFMNQFVGTGQRKYYKIQVEQYDGQWKLSKRHGKGTLTIGKQKYVGEFQNDLYHGMGRYYYEDNLYEEGEYIEGKRVGIHKLISLETIKNQQIEHLEKEINYQKKFFCF